MIPKPRLLVAVLFILISSVAVRAQTTISGTVKNASGALLTDAVLVLSHAADSTVIHTELTDREGHYTLNAPLNQALIFRVTAIGFIPQQRTLTLAKDTTLNILLQPQSSKLGEVTVSARKPLLERRTDRTIFNVSASILAIGGNALEAVKKAPGVLVKESDQTLKIAGRR